MLLITLAVGLHYRAVGAPIANLATVAITYLVAIHAIGGVGQLVGISVPEEVEPVMVALLFGIVTDYTIFFISRFRGYIQDGTEAAEAAERTTADLLPTVFTAAISVAAASAVLVVAQLGFFRAFGPGTALAVLVALAVVTTFVPAVLALAGERILWPGRSGRAARRRPRWLLTDGRIAHVAPSAAHRASRVDGDAHRDAADRAEPAGGEDGACEHADQRAAFGFSDPRSARRRPGRASSPAQSRRPWFSSRARGSPSGRQELNALQSRLASRSNVAAVIGPGTLPGPDRGSRRGGVSDR